VKQGEKFGKARTVLGPVSTDSLGKTLIHEHFFINLSQYFTEPSETDEKRMAHEPVRMENLYWVRLHPFSNLDNLHLADENLATREATLFKIAGGGTITEVTPKGALGRKPSGLAYIARETGLNIIMGTGYYIGALHPAELASRTEQEIADEMVKELTVGIEDTGICAGIIGEIGCSMPLDEKERKILRCCADAQRRTGAAIYLHPSPDDDLVLENIRILKDAGADLSRVVVGHVDIMDYNDTTCRKLADAGCYIGFDSFGNEGFIHIPHPGFDVELSDVKRINDIIGLIKDSYLNHILISQDVSTRDRLTAYGGTGYAHILRDVVPIMRTKGLTEEQINTLLVENPGRVLSFAPAAPSSPMRNTNAPRR
jgi:phosphotriesterase-related protein